MTHVGYQSVAMLRFITFFIFLSKKKTAENYIIFCFLQKKLLKKNKYDLLLLLY